MSEVTFIMLLSQLKRKEIIVFHSGEKMGRIIDVVLNDKRDHIEALLVHKRAESLFLIQQDQHMKVLWEQIIVIGTDVIIIRGEDSKQLSLPK